MPSKAIYKRTLDGFAPANDDAAEFYGKTKLGQLVTLEGKQARNLGFHRLFFVMLQLISDNSRPHISKEAAELYAKMAAGVGQFEPDSRGGKTFIPGSISFASMDEAGFQEFVKTAIPPLVGRFMAGTAPDDVIAEAMALTV